MPSSRSKTRVALVEGTKVLALCLGFYLIQSQIFQVRYDMYGSTTGLRQAQARTTTELDDTQEFVRQALEDSTVELARAKRAVRSSLEDLQSEKREILRVLDERTRELESSFAERIARESSLVKGVRAVADANAVRLERISTALLKDSDLMKRTMLLPTVQLRGNGTVGSGVVIYSVPQSTAKGSSRYTTFALTAYHVVSEVMGGRLDRPLEEVHVFGESDPISTEVFSAKVILFDRDKDLALLRLNTTRRFSFLAQLTPRAELTTLDVFSPAYAVGCPLGNRPLPTLGEISSKSKKVGDQMFWMLNAPTFFGNSGGGIYQVPNCRLIGVSSMIYTYGRRQPTVVPHMGLFVPLETIYNWLDAEGYAFVYTRASVPRELRRKLAYTPTPDARPVPSTSRPSR